MNPRLAVAILFFAACTALLLTGLLATLQIIAPRIVDVAAAFPPEFFAAVAVGAGVALILKTLLD